MRKRTITSSASALLLLIASLASAKHNGIHEHLEVLHKRHRANRELATRSTIEDGEQGIEIRSVPETPAPPASLEKRQAQCAFPTDAGLVPVTPGDENGGWAMSPNQQCTPGTYCPYACPAGQVSVQWDPSATSYTYPKSMNGGLYCDQNGNIQKPFPNKPYCQATNSNIGVQNNAGGVVAFCQTVLPGNEAMLIPTSVTGFATIAVPDPSYWCETAAHYYINPPGIDTDQACVWGSNTNPYGNWSPYVAGANVDSSGNTFIKLGWNPIYLEPATPFRNQMPDWGVKIDCPNGGCTGLPCAIDPTQNKVNEMTGDSSIGAGGGAFCVVTVAKGSSANFVVFNAGGDSSDSGGNGGYSSSSSSGGKNGGQFFQSTSSWQSPTASSQSSSSGGAPTTSTESTWSWTSSSVIATSSVPAVSAWTGPPTATHNPYRLPTYSPYYSLFNHTTYAAPTGASEGASETTVEATAVPSGPSSSSLAPLSPATGGTSTFRLSVVSLFSALAVSVAVTL
ncbi:uncharacterized protein Z519_05080 [Cladophialophora bantiana CBS 173.52]|uniref:Murein transglycosylase n=1 Tax=Cladophialophora bantiana (strain ATCC 10958 / CBS 173.52 / CDC B-1940 / NIH 8579) TaxID=1442370 RepID=A0A0D2HSB4_CLAB1|nr:uncharacterized protein Z519_05080 [Cladophialophora bantiana CBS 173.52]KIW93765.1 hypothetical protein Z519_05080 [Cladophialophora bantiana CBS 173.52]